jgi:hypothetical protein
MPGDVSIDEIRWTLSPIAWPDSKPLLARVRLALLCVTDDLAARVIEALALELVMRDEWLSATREVSRGCVQQLAEAEKARKARDAAYLQLLDEYRCLRAIGRTA